MLKVEPREADRLPMPSPDLVREHRDALITLRPKVTAALRSGRLLNAVALVDEVLLVDALGMTRAALLAVRNEHRMLAARRGTRGKENARG